jgi:hypothetical protein
MCFAPNLNIFFVLPSTSCKFIVSKWIIICYKEEVTIVASSTALILKLNHALTSMKFIFDFTFVANGSTTMPHALGPHDSTFVNNIFHI